MACVTVNVYLGEESVDSLARIASLQNAAVAQKGKAKDKAPARETKTQSG